MHVHNDTKVVHPVSVMTRTLASYVSLFLVSVFFAVITSKLTSSSLSASTPTLQVPNPLRRLRHQLSQNQTLITRRYVPASGPGRCPPHSRYPAGLPVREIP